MIDHLHGTLCDRSPTHVVIDVGGVGYGVAVSLSTFEKLPEKGAQVHLCIYTYVREDRLELFGFADADERRMFTLLLGVSGIGPNSAQKILSGMSATDLHQAISQDQVAELTQIRGVGRRTAERVVVELRDKIGAVRAGATQVSSRPTGDGAAAEAALALVALGIAEAAANKAVEKALTRCGAKPSLQELIKHALRER